MDPTPRPEPNLLDLPVRPQEFQPDYAYVGALFDTNMEG